MNKIYIKCITLFASALMFSINHFTMAAQYCNTTIPTTIADGQLVENGDGTVTDTKTGLMWKQQSEKTDESGGDYLGGYSWEEAISKAASSTYAGHTDWRVPNSKELLSLVEWRCAYPAIKLQYFPELGDQWSRADRVYSAVDRTIDQGYNDDQELVPRYAGVTTVDFDSGSVSQGPTYFPHHLRLVRDAN